MLWVIDFERGAPLIRFFNLSKILFEIKKTEKKLLKWAECFWLRLQNWSDENIWDPQFQVISVLYRFEFITVELSIASHIWAIVDVLFVYVPQKIRKFHIYTAHMGMNEWYKHVSKRKKQKTMCKKSIHTHKKRNEK